MLSGTIGCVCWIVVKASVRPSGDHSGVPCTSAPPSTRSALPVEASTMNAFRRSSRSNVDGVVT